MLVCIKHPNFNGKDKPDISCRACCCIFLQRVKKELCQHQQLLVSSPESKISVKKKETSANQ